MSLSSLQFDADIAKFAEKIGQNLATVCQRLALEIHTNIVKRTPVDTGRARASWQISTGTPSDYLPDEEQETFTENTGDFATLARIDGKEMIYIVNNLPYIERLEFGWSEQAPAGMVRVSLAEAAARIELMLERLP